MNVAFSITFLALFLDAFGISFGLTARVIGGITLSLMILVIAHVMYAGFRLPQEAADQLHLQEGPKKGE